MYDTGIQAIRFGELPGNGRSINFLASEFDDGGELTSAVYEAGVSVFRMKDGRADIEIETFRQLRSALNRRGVYRGGGGAPPKGRGRGTAPC